MVPNTRYGIKKKVDGEETDVVVVSGAATIGIDLTLTYIPLTFDPPVNLVVFAENDWK